jgi:hypothetical protein
LSANYFPTKRVMSRQAAAADGPTSLRVTASVLMVGLMTCMGSHAGTIDIGDGLSAVWTLNTSLTGGWRTRDPDSRLIGPGDGGNASAFSAGPATLNFKKGDNFTTLLRIVGDVDLKKGDTGFVLRAKAWDNYRLSQQSVPFGAPSNDFMSDQRLSDQGFDTRLSKFRGAALLDAYGYTTFALSEATNMKVRLGQHAVNWGESLFIPGVNQYSVLDVTALRQPGTLLKEAILPVPQISANVGGLPAGISIEAFYQFKWMKDPIDGCGTYWSPATSLNCRRDALDVPAPGFGTSGQQWNGTPLAGGANFRVPKGPDREPGNAGQFGIALKKTVDAIDTEFGAYYVNYSTHLPNISAARTADAIPGSVFAGIGSSFWDYSAKNIKVFGLSASTAVGGWAVAGELSHTRDFPVQVSGTDSFFAFALAGPGGTPIGPVADRFPVSRLGTGDIVAGYDLKNKTQIQLSTIKSFSKVLGASMTLVGEVAYQHWSGIGNPYTDVRYGRPFEFGAGPHVSFGGTCPAQATNPDNCNQKGYFTPDAWGMRGQVELEYTNVLGLNLKPRAFVSVDAKGWSADGTFSEGRRALSLGLKAEYLRKYTADLSYTTFNHNAFADTFRDRDFIALVLAASF